MLDVAALGRRIQQRRKTQRLTQEQLGTEMGVSAQAVSRWETGESAPDIGLLPDLCRALGASADTLLGVSGIGVESLSADLAQRIGDLDEVAADEILLDVLGRLHRAWVKDRLGTSSTNLIFKWAPEGGLVAIGLWQRRGLACFALGETLAAAGWPPTDVLDKLRLLLAPGHWELATRLLAGPQKEHALLHAGVAATPEELRSALAPLIESGLVIQDHEGYRLTPTRGLLWAGLLSALCGEDLTHAGIGLFSGRIG